MAPSKKTPKFANSSSVTLHNFFTPTSSKSCPPLAKRKSNSDKKKPRPDEIIIIDSDDDDVDTTPSRSALKKPRLSQSSDIEIVEEPDSFERRPSGSGTALRKQSPPTPISFGQPSELLLSTSTSSFSTKCDSESSSTATFGRPTDILLSSHERPSASAKEATNDILEDVLVENGFEIDDWGLGDDEMGMMLVEDDDIEAENALTEELQGPDVDMKPPDDIPDIKPGPSKLKSAPSMNSGGGNAFSVLMSSHKENEAWKEADAAEDRSFRPNPHRGESGRRKAPFYKVLQGMPIAVDAFRYGAIPGVTAYFLTHAHSDHYTNLSSNWTHGPIYCSQGTANLIIHMLKVPPKWVHALPMNVPTVVPDTGGVQVTLIEANHCPGSCLFMFEGRQTVNAGDSTYKSAYVGSTKVFRYLHCGDFRASPAHVHHPSVKGKKIDAVYLDTTYLDPKYTFPPQPLVISACAELARKLSTGESLREDSKGIQSWIAPRKAESESTRKALEKLLVVVGTYSIGKERIVKAIAKALNTKVYCDARKTGILRCQDDPELHEMLTNDPFKGNVHLVPLSVITSDRLKPYFERFQKTYSRAIGFRPTGWTYAPPAGMDQNPTVAAIISRASQNNFTHNDLRAARGSTTAVQMYGVPYSEHSSFSELTCFAMSFDWMRMIATVNVGSENSRNKMARWVKKWETEKKKANGTASVVAHRHPEYW